MKKAPKNVLRSMIKGERRKLLVQNGAYDGRFSPKVIKDKKKEADKRNCRRKLN